MMCVKHKIIMLSATILFLALVALEGHVAGGVLSEPCSDAILALAARAVDATCLEPMAQTLYAAANFSKCTEDLNGVDCMNPSSVMQFTGYSNNVILHPTVLKPKSTCPLCEADQTLLPSCYNLLGDVLAIVSGIGIEVSDYNGADVTGAAYNVSLHCSSEVVSVARLRYQSKVVCASGSSYGYSITPYGTLDNALDMRYLMQCGTCGIMPCLPGQLCSVNQPPQPCPGGHYCPDSTEAIKCPTGYYCPIASAYPIKCHSFGFNTCPEGSEREVVWVPLVWSLTALIIFALASKYGPQSLQNMFGYERQVKVDPDAFGIARAKSLAKVGGLNLSPLRVHIEFTALDLITNRIKRLDGVSGTIRSGRFTAIMGASGAGKTTLMNALMGKEKIDHGIILYRDDEAGNKISPPSLKSSVAFVPQDDILLREMTVEQLLYQSAAWRLPVTMSKDEKAHFVEDVITKMKLGPLRHTIVGGGESAKAGISPGDRKAVNIAVELVSKPVCIFLDEPTTNLDASSALNVASVIHSLAESKMTCVAVIHQPRKEIFSLIDDLILLVPGGRMAYNGPADRVIDWFTHIGFPLKFPTINKADFVIDLTSGNFEGCGKARNENEESKEVVNWSQHWFDGKDEFFELFAVNESAAVSLSGDVDDSVVHDLTIVETVCSHEAGGAIALEKRPGFLQQLFVCTKVSFLQELKENRLLVDCITHLMAGCILGIVNAGGALLLPPLPDTYNLSCPPESYETCNWMMRYQLGPATFYITALLGIVVIPSAVRTFGREVPVFRRNFDVGANVFAYFCGKTFVNMILTIPKVICFTAPILAIAAWSSPFEYFCGIFVALSICICGLSYVVSLLLWNPDVAILLTTIYCIVVNLLGGFVPLLGDGFYAKAFHARWSARAIVTSELIYGRKFSEALYNSMFSTPWRHPDYKTDLLVLVVMGAGFHALAAALLWRKAIVRT